MPLTDLALRNAKPKDKPYKLFDGGGLHLLVNPNGSRIWRLAYRFAGKPKQLSFGPYPTVPLVEARQKREESKRQLLAGEDPSAVRKLEKVAASVSSANTFSAVAEEFIERLKGRGIAEVTLAKKRWLLTDLAGPSLGHRPIAEISPFEILSVLQQVERSGRRETARRLRSSIGAVFRFNDVTPLRFQCQLQVLEPVLGYAGASRCENSCAIGCRISCQRGRRTVYWLPSRRAGISSPARRWGVMCARSA
ncbi:DUF4102 domain-containing protein [Xanthobacter sp. 126]|uniref:tyrosine-type recombinase/integrase n=1 Tax=Xanthobacter sp. 126 TaxID=1131814 RepID=UPI0012DEE8BC|nr:DUF4102 domain-containing protein [Xanthobacter sp. 126]